MHCNPEGSFLFSNIKPPRDYGNEKVEGVGSAINWRICPMDVVHNNKIHIANMNRISPNLDRKRLKNTSLSETELSVILGGLLGDGSLKIHPGYKNARYAFRHSARQSDYFASKCALLQSISSPGSVQRQQPDGWSKQEKLRYCSRALPDLTTVHSVTHSGNRLTVRRRWLNHLTAQSLAIWWCDDGSLVANGRRGCISSDRFSEAECEILAKYLLVVWGISVRVGGVQNRSKLPPGFQGPIPSRWRLWFSTGQLQSFLQIILPYCPCTAMVYKFKIRYKSAHFQQRWISQMAALLSPHISPGEGGPERMI